MEFVGDEFGQLYICRLTLVFVAPLTDFSKLAPGIAGCVRGRVVG